MRIAVLAHSFPRFPGDTHGPFVRRLSEELAGCGHEVDVLVPWDPELAPPPKGPESPLEVRSFRYVVPERLHLLGYSRTLKRDVGLKLVAYALSPLYFLAAERALVRLVREREIDLVHAHWILPNGYVASRVSAATGVPYAVTLHGSDVFMAERNPLFGRMARRALAGASYVTSCSPDLSRRLLAVAGLGGGADGKGREGRREGAPEPADGGGEPGALDASREAGDGDGGHPASSKVLLVPNGTDLPPPDAGADAAAAIGREVGLAEGDRAVVAVGRMVDKKGFDYLVAAAPEILAADPRVRLVLGGGGDLLPRYRAEAERLGVADRVLFPGQLSHDRVLALLAAAEVFVMPSVRDPAGNIDGLPVVVLEAMAASRPVVATDVAGIPLAVVPGETGLLVPEKDPTALAAGAVRLLAAPEEARRMGEAGRARVERELTWEAVARRHDELARRAVGEEPRGNGGSRGAGRPEEAGGSGTAERAEREEGAGRSEASERPGVGA